MDFEIVSDVEDIEVIASGSGIRVLEYLQKNYGRGYWRKLKGIATVLLPNGSARRVEVHWYEAHGIGKRDFKIKYYLDD